MWTYWTNNTCDPTTDKTTPCTRGKYPQYVVDAKTVKDVIAAVNWARNANIRLVIRNTGHDFMGKSIGANALTLWMHNFKEVKFIKNYFAFHNSYRGSAVKVGAGWQLGDLYKEANKNGVVVLGGECAGVGFAGGFIQGGGHGPLSSIYGLAADHVLEFEVVTASGHYAVVNKKSNPDLFWALRGGGGAAFAVVLSVTVKTFPELTTAAHNITLGFGQNDLDTFWKGVTEFHKQSAGWIEKGIYVYYDLLPPFLSVQPVLAPGKTKAELDALLQPLYDAFGNLGVQYTSNSYQFPDFYTAYMALFQGEGGGSNMLTSGRIIPRGPFSDNPEILTNLMREMAELPNGRGRFFIGHIFKPSNNGGVNLEETSVTPAWKTSYTLPLWNLILTGQETEEQKQAAIDDVNLYDEKMKEITPGGGAYLNEANIFDPDWIKEFYGSEERYNRLMNVKNKYDPYGLFWAETAVGSQKWVKTRPDDRLCPVNA